MQKGPTAIDLFCSLILVIRYGDTSVQRNCIFPGRYAPLTWLRGHEYAITSCSITVSPPLTVQKAITSLLNVWFCFPFLTIADRRFVKQ